jgi:hypothetical protein
MSITGYRLWEGLVEHMDRVPVPQKMVGTGIFFQNPPYRVFQAADDHEDLRRQTMPLLRLRPSSIMRSLEPRPQVLATASERRALPLLPRCPPLIQHPRPTVDPYVPFFTNTAPPLCRESICEYLVTKTCIGLVEREIHVPVYDYYDFPKPSIHGFSDSF